MTAAVIVSTARTPLAKSWRGAFNLTHGATLGGHAVRHALERARLAPADVDDVVMGCALPEGATGWNIARQIALRAGCPVEVPGMTVNRFCSSGLQSIALAAQRIVAGEAEAIAAPIRKKYEEEGHPLYATSRLWDDGVIEPGQTRAAVGLALAAARFAPVPEFRPPVYRM